MTDVWIGGFQVPPLVVPVVIGYAVLAAVVLWWGRRRRALVVPWVLFVGAMVVAAVATLTPPIHLDNPELYGDFVGRQCALGTPDMSWSAITGQDQRLLNVALFVPIAACAVAAATTIRRRIGVALLAVVLLLPVVVETIQWAVPSLMRACDADDLADNYVGLALGLGAGALLVGLRWAARRESARLTP